jgi:hypothetical protein
MSDLPSINRLGFGAWADNLIVNALENIVEPVSMEIESDKAIIVFRVEDGYTHVTVRAYVPGLGWQYHDRVMKNKVAPSGLTAKKPARGKKKEDNQGKPTRS